MHNYDNNVIFVDKIKGDDFKNIINFRKLQSYPNFAFVKDGKYNIDNNVLYFENSNASIQITNYNPFFENLLSIPNYMVKIILDIKYFHIYMQKIYLESHNNFILFSIAIFLFLSSCWIFTRLTSYPLINLYKVNPSIPQNVRNNNKLSDTTAPYEHPKVIKKYS